MKGSDKAWEVVLLHSALPAAVVRRWSVGCDHPHPVPALAGSGLTKVARPRPFLTHHQIKIEEPKII